MYLVHKHKYNKNVYIVKVNYTGLSVTVVLQLKV